MERKPYPTDVSDAEWALVAPYLTLMTEDAPQREHPLREVFNGLRWIVRAGSSWRMMPHDLPPWDVVYQQTQRWLKAGVFEALVYDLRAVLRIAEGRQEMPTAAIFDSRTMQSTPESGGRSGYDGAKRRKGSKVHLAVDTLGNLLALSVTAADEQDRAQVSEFAKRVQEETGETVEIAFVDQGYTGENAAEVAEEHGIKLECLSCLLVISDSSTFVGEISVRRYLLSCRRTESSRWMSCQILQWRRLVQFHFPILIWWINFEVWITICPQVVGFLFCACWAFNTWPFSSSFKTFAKMA